MLGNFVCFFVICGFFLINFFKQNLSGIPSECLTAWVQIRSDKNSGLVWVQTVCKGYQQMTKVATSRERVKSYQNCVRVIMKNSEVSRLQLDAIECRTWSASTLFAICPTVLTYPLVVKWMCSNFRASMVRI